MTTSESPRIAWVTGAGKGIGRAVAKRLAGDGWTVAISARTEADLFDLRADCPDEHVFVYPLDVTDPDESRAVVDRIERQLGPVDLVILNAGTHTAMTADQFAIETVRHLVEINLMGTVNGLAPIVERFMDRRSGHIAVVASLAGYVGLPSAAAYGASKAALINMCEALKPDLDRHGVCISVINPGFVATPLTDRNDFPMPFLISVDDAAAAIVTGLKRRSFEIAFPRRFALWMKLLRLMPYRVFFAITRRLVRS